MKVNKTMLPPAIIGNDNLKSLNNEDYYPKITSTSCKPNLVKCKAKKKTYGTPCSPCELRNFKPKKRLK